MYKIVTKGIMLLVIGALMIGCSGNKKSETNEQRYITIKGSDTMLHLATNWSEDLMENNPNTDISVTGGGSGTGIAALLNGTTDICVASRSIKDKELKQAEELGIEVKEFVVARDGIAVVVNPDNPVSNLSTTMMISGSSLYLKLLMISRL